MNAVLLTALWIHLTACALVVGALSMSLLAGPARCPAMYRWEEGILRIARWSVLVALGSGIIWLVTRTALFEGRPDAAHDVLAVSRAALDTWPGQVWIARHGLLLVLAAFLSVSGDVSAPRNWWVARVQAFVMSALVLTSLAASGHSATISKSQWPTANDMLHLLGAGVWVGGLLPLALLLYAASRDRSGPGAYAVRAAQRFSCVALGTVLALAGTGVISAFLLIGSVAGFLGTTHGRLLLAKIALIVPILMIAAKNRALLARLRVPGQARRYTAAKSMAMYVALEAGLAFVLLALAATMTATTPARHSNPVWLWPVRIQLDSFAEAFAWLNLWQSRNAFASAVLGLVLLFLAGLAARRRALLLGSAAVLLAGAGVIGLRPLVVEAFPTSYWRAPVSFRANSIEEGMAVYQHYCASCHGASSREPMSEYALDLRRPPASRRSAGELYWLISHGRPKRGMPEFGSQLEENDRWNVINYIRALGFAADTRHVGREVEPDHAWLLAPDFTFSVGPLTPMSLSDFRGRRLVLVVLYALPGSRERMSELARRYGALSVQGVEVFAVSPQASFQAIAALGSQPPVLFPVATDGNEAIATAYRLFAPGSAHAEFLIDRQGFIRAIWRSDRGGMPDSSDVQRQVERLNEEREPPPLADDHIH
jgi:putative copper export protein/mono/diheme cytochrome c family protein/peroxiredoxin